MTSLDVGVILGGGGILERLEQFTRSRTVESTAMTVSAY